MQYPPASDPDCSTCARAAMLDGSLSCLWPSNTPEDVIRRALAVILCEDPDHRLRVAHLEPLLHMALGPQQLPCSSGRLQALLTDPSTAKIFPVDFSAQVPDWRSRVVYLDMTQLTASLSSAKAHRLQQQQQHADASGVDQDASTTRLQRGSSSGCSESAALDSHLVGPDGDHSSTSVTDPSQQHQQHAAAAASAGSNHNRPAPLALENIFGSSPAFSAGGPGLPAGRSSSQGGGAAAGSMQAQPGHHNSSSSMPAVTPKEPGSDSSHRGVSSSLFGGSFEVPYAIASCWATGNQAGSFGTAHSGPKGHPVLADTAGAADGGGSSSLASASSTRSFAGPAAASAGAAGAITARPATGSSRLRNASSMQGGDGTAGEPAAANSIDVCTPRSGIAAPAGADRSPLLSSADCEEDAGEYSEAALVFGSVSNAAAGGAALAAAGSGDRSATAGRAVTVERSASSGIGAPAADSAGQLEAEESFSMQGVDWSCMAGLEQQQQSEAAYHYQQQQAAQQQQQQQQALLFGLDDFGADGLTPRSSGAGGPGSAAAHNSALAAAATGALTARRLLMEHAGLREDTGSFHNPNVLLGSHHSPHHLAALASSLGALGSGSAPATLQQQQQHEQLLLAAAAAAGSGRGFGGYGHERLLLDPEGLQGYGLSGQQHMAALASSLQGGSYGSGGLLGSDRSLGSGFWASPAAMQQHFLMQQQQHQRQQQQAAAAAAVAVAAAAAQSQQQQQMRASLGGGPDGTIDTSFGIDQIGKADQQHPVGSAGTPGKGGALGASAFGRPAGSSQGGQQELAAERSSSSSIGAAPGASALTPRLTGWASVAAKEPPAGTGPQQQAQSAGSASLQGGMKAGQAGSTGSAASKAGGADAGQGKAVAKLPPRVKAEVQHLVSQFQGVLKLEDFDDGVVHQLNAKRTEDEAVAAVRNIAHYELGTIQHMAAYLNHVVKNFNAAAAAAAAAAADTTVGLSNALAVAAAAAVAANSHAAAVHGGSSAATAATMQQLLGASMLGGNGSLGSTVGAGRGGPAAGAGGAAGLGAYGGQIRLTSVPVSTKAMLQKLPLKVFKQIELLVQNSAYLEWRHFDAGVIKVLSQLSKLCEGDVFEELELLAATDLSNVEYMPAYLNKRLNNKLWSRRKAEGHVPG